MTLGLNIHLIQRYKPLRIHLTYMLPHHNLIQANIYRSIYLSIYPSIYLSIIIGPSPPRPRNKKQSAS